MYSWHTSRQAFSSTDSNLPLTVVCISDTHNGRSNLPLGDLLIHAGDMTQKGTFEELQAQLDWLNEQPHAEKIVIAGNHDVLMDHNFASTDARMIYGKRQELHWGSIHYLQDTSVNLKFRGGRSIEVFGSPWTRKHGNWAFQDTDSESHWRDKIPLDTDIVITHMPLQCHLDLDGEGDPALLQEIKRAKPKLHCFGHFHASYGSETMVHDSIEDAFEQAMQPQASLWHLVMFAFACLRSLRRGRVGPQTVLVNASYVGGFLDDRRREPIVVRI